MAKKLKEIERRVEIIESDVGGGTLETQINSFLKRYDRDMNFNIIDIKWQGNSAMVIYEEKMYVEDKTFNGPASFDGISGYDLSKEELV